MMVGKLTSLWISKDIKIAKMILNKTDTQLCHIRVFRNLSGAPEQNKASN